MATIFLIAGLGRAFKEFRAFLRPNSSRAKRPPTRGYSRPISMIPYIDVLVLALTIELNLFLERTCKRRDRLTERRHKVTQFMMRFDLSKELGVASCGTLDDPSLLQPNWLCPLLTPCAQSTDSSVQEAMDIKRDCSERR
mmetsp:Transcript_17953/g.32480  ORF Transcript_17953/g.32480 Transcript_17953/m.32480 type:complete len:140 (+) Transcript_17953:824-1243(+)